MNSAITIRFLTPYVSSITRDQDYVHCPLPLDGALAHAAYWEALVAGRVADSPTAGQADPALMREVVTPELDAIFASATLGAADLLNDASIAEQVYAVSSGFPVLEGQVYLKRGARWLNLDTGAVFAPDYEVQPIRKRVPMDRLAALDVTLVGERGDVRTGEVETGKGVLKAIDNRMTTWQVYEYVWFAEVRDEQRLRQLLAVLKYQGMGKKHTAGFGKVLDYDVQPFAARTGDNLLHPWCHCLDPFSCAAAPVVIPHITYDDRDLGCGDDPPLNDFAPYRVTTGILVQHMAAQFQSQVQRPHWGCYHSLPLLSDESLVSTRAGRYQSRATPGRPSAPYARAWLPSDRPAAP